VTARGAAVAARMGVALALAGCAHAPSAATRATGATGDDAVLDIRSNVSDADLVIDGRVVGRIVHDRIAVALDPGHHQLELRHDDFFSAYLDVQLARAEHKKIVLDLSPILP